jgi:hypothetical protein
MVPDEGGPALVVAAMRAWRLPNVFPNRPWREPNLELEPKFICNSLFAPAQIFGSPFDELSAAPLPISLAGRLVSISNARSGGRQLDASRSTWLV